MHVTEWQKGFTGVGGENGFKGKAGSRVGDSSPAISATDVNFMIRKIIYFR
ncbi:hypothetical protein [Pontibacter qinzhouensis]|uniref:hypothetical protein n=1 Tax=Pontibacter qinzhouensis TaxID=2603253 RepID=UPI00164FACE0|nr:hypothetical protein [Pontibacter qinzhouensis]